MRNSMQAMRSAESRVASALAARTSAEQLFESQQRLFRSGTTTFGDMYYFESDIARETKAAGLRGVLGETMIDFPAPVSPVRTFSPGARVTESSSISAKLRMRSSESI